MILVTGSATFDPADRQALESLWDAVRTVTLTEAGCISYDLYADRHDDGRLLLFEEWADRASLDAHLQAPHLAAFRDVRDVVKDFAMEFTIYEASPDN